MAQTTMQIPYFSSTSFAPLDCSNGALMEQAGAAWQVRHYKKRLGKTNGAGALAPRAPLAAA
jgi:hypothetical protein